VKTRILFVIISILIFSQICFAQFYAKLKNISAGEYHTLALADNNSLWACGGYYADYCPQLGLCDEVYRTPLLQHVCGPNGVGNLNNIIAFDAGWVHSIVLDVSGCGCCSYENNVALCIVNAV